MTWNEGRPAGTGRQVNFLSSEARGLESKYTAQGIHLRRRNYGLTEVLDGSRIIGQLTSTQRGFHLSSRDHRLRWMTRRHYRTPNHLLDAMRLLRNRNGGDM